MTTTTIRQQHDTDERTAPTTGPTTVPIERPTVTRTSTSARTLAKIAGGMAVIAALSALSAAGYRAYVADQAPVVAITTTQSHLDLDSADAGPRSRHGVVTSSSTTAAARADDIVGTTHGRVQSLPAGQAALADTHTTPRSLDDSEPPAKGLAGTGGISQNLGVQPHGLAQDRGTRVVG